MRNMDLHIFSNSFVPRSFINEKSYELVYGDVRNKEQTEDALVGSDGCCNFGRVGWRSNH